MAEPTNFEFVNEYWYGSGDVGELPVQEVQGTYEQISCWQLTDEEIDEIVRTGKVWLHVWAPIHPAVSVNGTSPWKEEKNDVCKEDCCPPGYGDE